MAPTAGIAFYELGNGVLLSRGVNRVIPTSVSAGCFQTPNLGRRSLCIDAAKSENLRVVPTSEMPGHGPPLLVQGFRPNKTRRAGLAQPKARLAPRITPPRKPNPPPNMPAVPPPSQTPSCSGDRRSARNSRSPATSRLSLPDLERRPTLNNATSYATSPALESQPHPMSIEECSILPHQPGCLNVEPRPTDSVEQPFVKAKSPQRGRPETEGTSQAALYQSIP